MTAVPGLERTATGAGAARGEFAPSELLAPLRMDVVDAIGHVLGNLFQRMQHLADRTAETDSLLGEEIRGAVGRLDEFLRVVLDYLSLRAIQPMALPLRTAMDALVQRLRMVLGTRARLDVQCGFDAMLDLDPGLLALGFDSLMKSLAPPRVAANPAVVRVTAYVAGTSGAVGPSPRAIIDVTLAPGLVSLSAEADVHRAVAQRVIELHGGTLESRRLPSGEVLWEIHLACRA